MKTTPQILTSVNEASGTVLDHLVAKASGQAAHIVLGDDGSLVDIRTNSRYSPSTDPALEYPIRKMGGISVSYAPDGSDDPLQPWIADDYAGNVPSGLCWGETPLIASMRCYVVSVLGEFADLTNA